MSDSPSADGSATLQPEMQQTLDRIASRKGVLGVIITTLEGAPILSTFDEDRTELYASKVAALATTARSALKDLDAQNDLTFLRLRSKKHEILVAPDKDFLLVTVQDPAAAQLSS